MLKIIERDDLEILGWFQDPDRGIIRIVTEEDPQIDVKKTFGIATDYDEDAPKPRTCRPAPYFFLKQDRSRGGLWLTEFQLPSKMFDENGKI